ncbi:MAG: excinuclease ABC subunit UvrC [Pelagibacteraceae bacterium]|jgi:excinuclease ABC subunit C|nr:excinuclease ABC subunit UvrC [Pelagibacteraceae bacterium]MDP6710229.1 excinuclease ABC subunit UvrC [Pelagibacteraceae bacterium]
MRNLDFGKELIRKKIPLVSNSPGVYRMLDKKDQVLYVGKAKNLPNRLKSYVLDRKHPMRTERMLALTNNLEIVTTDSEAEALLLEANLIKKFKPKFNILLRDDKSFPYIIIEKDCDWPQLSKHRGKKNKNGYYFGPFASAGSANWTIKILQKVFLLRVCNDSVFKNRDRPCILYQIKRCSAPCVNYLSKTEYSKLVSDTILFLSGKSKNIQKKLSVEMEKSSEKMDYEKAAILRDRIKALAQIQSSQSISSANLDNADVISIAQEAEKSCVQVFFYRSKQNWGNQSYFPFHDKSHTAEEVLASFIVQFYENKNVPSEILINKEIKDLNLIKFALGKKEEKFISIKIPTKGSALKLSMMAEKNAKEALIRKIFESETNNKLLNKIADKFKLDISPRTIEVFDNSHIQGTNSIGALITFGSEGFIKKQYRKFNIKNKELNAGDDYGMLKEVFERRFSKIIKSKKQTDVVIPDLVIIDGGKGQYSVGRKILDELGFHDIPIIAIAKGKNRNKGDETFFHKTSAIKLSKREPLLFFLQRLRDESHRFAVSSHRMKRNKNLTKSLLDQINGIGRTRKRALLNYFGSAKAVESASFDDLKRIEGIETSVAKKIHDFFHS